MRETETEQDKYEIENSFMNRMAVYLVFPGIK